MSQYTRKQIIRKINRELPIVVVYNYLVMNKHLIHKNAIRNSYILDGEIELEPIDLEDIDFEKDKAVKTYCLFHNTKNKDSTNFILPLAEEETSPNGKKKTGNFYNCFSCTESKKPLNPIHFYMVVRFGIRPQLLSVLEEETTKAYYKSIEELAALMGISYNDGKREISEEEKKKFRMQAILNTSADIYHRYLKSGDSFAKKAYLYLVKDRGFEALGKNFYKVIDTMKLGCAPKKYDSTFLYDQLKQKGFTDEELLESKVVIEKEKNGKTIIVDFHTNGIILPYTRGKHVHNLYCRKFTDEKKWRHMRLGGEVEYPVGFDTAQKFPFVIVVEGELDYLTFKALGFDNVICVGGIKGLKGEHINRLLYQYTTSEGERCRTVYVCLDGDEKGQEGVKKVADDLLEAGLDVRVIRMSVPHPKTGDMLSDDPNKFFQVFGLAVKPIFERLIEEAISYQAFKFLRMCETEQPKGATAQLGFVRRNSKLLGEIDPTEKLFIAMEVAEYFKIPAEWLLQTWKIVPPAPTSTGEVKPLPQEALDKSWLVLFDQQDVADACLERIGNVVVYTSAKEFIAAAKQHKDLSTIAIHTNIAPEFKDEVLHTFPHFKFKEFIATSAEQIRSFQNYEFMGYFRELQNPYVNAAS